MATRTLSIPDYVILVALLLSSAVIGVIFGFFKSKRSSAREFLLADGGMGVSRSMHCATRLSPSVSNPGGSHGAEHHGFLPLRGHSSRHAQRDLHLWHDVLLSRYVRERERHSPDVFFIAISWTLASTITALVFMPKFREMNFTSAYEVCLDFEQFSHHIASNLSSSI